MGPPPRRLRARQLLLEPVMARRFSFFCECNAREGGWMGEVEKSRGVEIV